MGPNGPNGHCIPMLSITHIWSCKYLNL